MELWRGALQHEVCLILKYVVREKKLAHIANSSEWDSWPPTNSNSDSIIWGVVGHKGFALGQWDMLLQVCCIIMVEKVFEKMVLFVSCERVDISFMD